MSDPGLSFLKELLGKSESAAQGCTLANSKGCFTAPLQLARELVGSLLLNGTCFLLALPASVRPESPDNAPRQAFGVNPGRRCNPGASQDGCMLVTPGAPVSLQGLCQLWRVCHKQCGFPVVHAAGPAKMALETEAAHVHWN